MSAAVSRLILGVVLLLAAVLPGVAVAANTNISVQVCVQAFASTTLSTTTPSPTMDTAAAVDGTAEPDSNVVITVNGVTQATLTAAPDGTFAANVPMVIGSNSIIATADDGAFCGHVEPSAPVVIQRDLAPPPAPQISAPASGFVTTATSVLTQGTAEAGATLELLVGGSVVGSVTVGGGGTFSISAPLAMGSNTIQARASNPAGTSPLSLPVTVTRQPVPIPPAPPPTPPAPTPPAPAPPPGSPPQITSPTTGVQTSSSSVIVAVRGIPGGLAILTVSGTQVATVTIGADGTAQVAVPLVVGENLISVRVGSLVSETILVHRLLSQPVAPVITDPQDGAVAKSPKVQIAGTAGPALRVAVMVGSKKAAEVTTDANGRFAVQVSLAKGLNLIYVELITGDDRRIRSTTILVHHEPEEAAPVSLQDTLAGLVTLPMAGAVLAVQALIDLLAAAADQPLVVAGAFILAFAGSTVSSGLLGLELLLLVPGMIRLALARHRDSMAHGRVIDTVTGRAIAFAQVTAGANHPVVGISDRHGGFAIPLAAGTDTTIEATRPGYLPVSTLHSGEAVDLAVEPSAAGRSPLEALGDLIIGTVSWCAIIFAAALGVYIFLVMSGPGSTLLAVLSVGLLLANVVTLSHQPHYRWGRITDLGGVPFGNVTVALQEGSRVVSSYRTDQGGRYTLHATPGDYRLTVTGPDGTQLHQEPVTVKRRPAYIGFGLRLPR